MEKLIVISHEFDVPNEVALINAMFEEGMGMFHLRKPLWDVDYQRYFLSKIKPDFLSKISVHQHHELINEFDLKFYHAREKHRKNVAKKEGLIYSTSFHHAEDISNEKLIFDYCFLGPVFDSISKNLYKSKLSYDFVMPSLPNQKVFALGGIKKDNIINVYEKGFYGAAVLGSVWYDHENALKNFKELYTLCKQNVHMF